VNSRERLLTALDGGQPDRLPVTTHHLMPYFLETYLGGICEDEFFERFGLDRIVWTTPHKPGAAPGDFADPDQSEPGFLESRRVASLGKNYQLGVAQICSLSIHLACWS